MSIRAPPKVNFGLRCRLPWERPRSTRIALQAHRRLCGPWASDEDAFGDGRLATLALIAGALTYCIVSVAENTESHEWCDSAFLAYALWLVLFANALPMHNGRVRVVRYATGYI